MNDEAILRGLTNNRHSRVIVTHTCESFKQAEKLYEFIKISLANVNSWNSFRPGLALQTKLTDKNGQSIGRLSQPGDLIKIMLPRWQANDRLYEWRRISEVEEYMDGASEVFFMTIRPAISPETGAPDPAHFLRPKATIGLSVVLKDKSVELQAFIRNEHLNFHNSGIRDILQNAVMGVIVAGGFYELQWNKLLKSVLRAGISRLSHLTGIND